MSYCFKNIAWKQLLILSPGNNHRLKIYVLAIWVDVEGLLGSFENLKDNILLLWKLHKTFAKAQVMGLDFDRTAKRNKTSRNLLHVATFSFVVSETVNFRKRCQFFTILRYTKKESSSKPGYFL